MNNNYKENSENNDDLIFTNDPQLQGKISNLLIKLKESGIVDLETQIYTLLMNMFDCFANETNIFPDKSQISKSEHELIENEFKIIANSLVKESAISPEDLLHAVIFGVLSVIRTENKELLNDLELNLAESLTQEEEYKKKLQQSAFLEFGSNLKKIYEYINNYNMEKFLKNNYEYIKKISSEIKKSTILEKTNHFIKNSHLENLKKNHSKSISIQKKL